MIRLCNYLISVAAMMMVVWGSTAQADESPPPRRQATTPVAAAPGDPVAAPPQDLAAQSEAATAGDRAAAPPSNEPVQVTEPTPAAAAPAEGISDAALEKLAEGETVEIFDERPDKPFDRDTEVRLTGAELAARGAVDLATALALLPDVAVRDAGRGGFNIDIRGARKGAVSILIDGVLVTDPYYGTFDVSTIPITDIVQIRVATTPQSPIDGPGGPGGVIEVHTRDAIGPRLAVARITTDSLPSLGMTGTARIGLARHLALRLSASGLGGARDLELPGDAAIGEDRRAVTGTGRIEYRDGDRRVVLDGFLDDRHYVSPPSDTMRSTILLIDRETTARASAKADDKIGALQLQGQVWTQYLERRSRYYSDPDLTSELQIEDLRALRSGAMALATRPFLRDFCWALSTTVDFERAVVSNIANDTVRGKTTLVEAAGDLQYERKQFRADVAVGGTVPFGGNARAWPEAKAVAKIKPIPDLELTATGAYKGRVPSLRERFDAANGNPGLGPERIAHAELRAAEHITDRLHVELAPYYKHSTGTIRASVDPMNLGQLVNLGSVSFWGVDSQARVTPHRMVEVGAGYEYVRAHSSDRHTSPEGVRTGYDPIDRLPHHRWDAWVKALPDARISALARLTYFGSAVDQTRRVDGYTLVEANLTAQITKQYLAVLRVDDLLNIAPETRAGYHMPGRVISIVMQGTWE
jgi:outer membrane cobalamin receptor